MDLNTMAAVFILVVAPVLCALSIPLLRWLEDRNNKKQAEINKLVDELHK